MTAADGRIPAAGGFKPGERFHGYVVERMLGKGAVGTVYLVRHELLDTLFALKVMDPDLAQNKPESVRRFLREAKLASRIRHPNLVTVHDAGFDNGKGVYYIVMDYIKGGTLRQAIAFGGVMDEKDAVNVVIQVASALEAAQPFGVVHRDIKPENIMLSADGTVKLVDLGVAKIVDGRDSFRTMPNAVFGTPSYISPEQAMDASTVDVRADIYSLGIVFFEMLCGRRPYDGDNAGEVIKRALDPTPVPDVRILNPKVSTKIAAVVLLMCAKKREDRIATPQALLEVLARLGYTGMSPSSVSEMRTSVAEEDTVNSLYNKPREPATATRSFDTDDEDIQKFVAGLKRRRRMRLLTWGVIGLFALAIAVAVVGWFLR